MGTRLETGNLEQVLTVVLKTVEMDDEAKEVVEDVVPACEAVTDVLSAEEVELDEFPPVDPEEVGGPPDTCISDAAIV